MSKDNNTSVGNLAAIFTIMMMGTNGHNIGPTVIGPTLEFAGGVAVSHQQQLEKDNSRLVQSGGEPTAITIQITYQKDGEEKPVPIDVDQAILAYKLMQARIAQHEGRAFS